MSISALPPVPLRSDTNANFVAKADAFMAALPTFVNELNAMGTALNLATSTTSSTSNLIGTGSKTFTVPAGLGYQLGMSLSIASTASPTNNMFGTVTAYSSTTLTVNVTSINGSGTFAAWTIALAAASVGAGLGTNTFSGVQNYAQGADIASAATIDLTNATGNTVNITGTTAISAVTLGVGQTRLVKFAAACPLTYNVTTHNLNTNGQSTVLAPGDFVFYQNLSGTVYGLIIKASGASAVGPVGELFDWPFADTPLYGLLCNGAAVSSTTYAALFAKAVKTATVTLTIASPCVISWTAHPLFVGAPVFINTTGALPTGLTAGTTVYVIAAGFTANSFQVSLTPGGAAINTSGTQSGVHTAVFALHGCATNLSTFNVPNIPADYTTVQANANEGSQTVGQNLSHIHLNAFGNSWVIGPTGVDNIVDGSSTTSSVNDANYGGMATSGGSANLAAGLRVRKCIYF